MDLIMEICGERIQRNCLGCPFKEKATRKATCMQWIDSNRVEADKIAEQYKANGNCLYNRNDPPFVGLMKNGKFQQICDHCDHVHILKRREVYKDEYIGKWVYECPTCHHISLLRQMKKTVSA